MNTQSEHTSACKGWHPFGLSPPSSSGKPPVPPNSKPITIRGARNMHPHTCSLTTSDPFIVQSNYPRVLKTGAEAQRLEEKGWKSPAWLFSECLDRQLQHHKQSGLGDLPGQFASVISADNLSKKTSYKEEDSNREQTGREGTHESEFPCKGRSHFLFRTDSMRKSTTKPWEKVKTEKKNQKAHNVFKKLLGWTLSNCCFKYLRRSSGQVPSQLEGISLPPRKNVKKHFVFISVFWGSCNIKNEKCFNWIFAPHFRPKKPPTFCPLLFSNKCLLKKTSYLEQPELLLIFKWWQNRIRGAVIMTMIFCDDPLQEDLQSWLLDQELSFQRISVTFLISVDQ